MRFADPHNFPSVWLAAWWALQTVTTAGYGDVVPTTVAGRLVGSAEMVLGVAFISFVTAGVTSAVIQRFQLEQQETDRARDERNTQTIIDALDQATRTLTELRERVTTSTRRSRTRVSWRSRGWLAGGPSVASLGEYWFRVASREPHREPVEDRKADNEQRDADQDL